MSVHPYLFFSGAECATAFERYRQILGGQLEIITNADMAERGDAMPGAEPHHVMHAALSVGETMLMGSDDPTGDGGQRKGIAVVYAAADEQTAERIFGELAEGGTVDMAFEATSWSKGFGACTDRFGVPWMVDTEGEP